MSKISGTIMAQSIVTRWNSVCALNFNEGNKDSMMPTITERWAPAGADSQLVVMRNRDKYYHEVRLNEVRITFMKNLVDKNYVFVGVYRLSFQRSDTTCCVWERVAEECDLNHLEYLEELRN